MIGNFFESSFAPTESDVADLNKIREHYGLPLIEVGQVKTVGDWWRLCEECDVLADQPNERLG